MKTMQQIKRQQLQNLYNKAVEIRSSAYMFNNLPENALHHLEQACEYLHLAVSHFDVEMAKISEESRKGE